MLEAKSYLASIRRKEKTVFHALNKQYQFLFNSSIVFISLFVFVMVLCIHSRISHFYSLVMMMMKTNVVLFSDFLFLSLFFSPFSLLFSYKPLFAFAIACLYIRQCSNWHTLPFNPNRNWDCRKREKQQKTQSYVTSTYTEKLIYCSPIFFFNRSLSPFGSKQMQIWISAISIQWIFVQ